MVSTKTPKITGVSIKSSVRIRWNSNDIEDNEIEIDSMAFSGDGELGIESAALIAIGNYLIKLGEKNERPMERSV